MIDLSKVPEKYLVDLRILDFEESKLKDLLASPEKDSAEKLDAIQRLDEIKDQRFSWLQGFESAVLFITESATLFLRNEKIPSAPTQRIQ